MQYETGNSTSTCHIRVRNGHEQDHVPKITVTCTLLSPRAPHCRTLTSYLCLLPAYSSASIPAKTAYEALTASICIGRKQTFPYQIAPSECPRLLCFLRLLAWPQLFPLLLSGLGCLLSTIPLLPRGMIPISQYRSPAN